MIRRIGEAENPYVVRVAEEDYAGPRSIFPTADRVIGDAVNPYTVSPESAEIGTLPIGPADARRRWRDAPSLIDGPESTNVENRQSDTFMRSASPATYVYGTYPKEPALTVPDKEEMLRRLKLQRDAEDEFLRGATEVPRKRSPGESFIFPGRKVNE